MKNKLKSSFNIIVKIVVFFIHPFFIRGISFIITSFSTQYIIKQLKKCGKNPVILFPITTHGLKYVSFGDNINICSRLRLESHDKYLNNRYTPEVIIGDNVSINYDCHIGCINKIVIGNNVLIASKVFITDHFHGDTGLNTINLPPNLRPVLSKGPVIIEDNVWIGEGVSIMPNITIGKNSIIGANSVVTKNIPKNSVVVGNPARIIKILI